MSAERWLRVAAAPVRVTSRLKTMTDDEARAAIAGLPPTDYDVIVKPLRYRGDPHLAAITVFDDHEITIQVPEPFLPFGEIVIYGAKRMPGNGMRFVSLSEGVTFRSRAEVVRFLYCHEWYHWFLYEIRGKGWSSETACDRFALRNYRRRRVTMEDAERALRRERDPRTEPVRTPARAAKRPRPPQPRVVRLPGFDEPDP